MQKYTVVITSVYPSRKRRYLVSIYKNDRLWNIPPSFVALSMVRKYIRDMSSRIIPHPWNAFYSVEITKSLNYWKV